MSIETSTDPRTALVREKYFSLRPKPLEQWLWAAKAPGSAERVFWYHWDIGHQNGTWVSQVPLRIVAKECRLDAATVTRAYQWLKARGLVRRIDAGRDDANPFRQATALTEVYVPRELLKRLAAEPNRRRREGRAEVPEEPRLVGASQRVPTTPGATPTPVLSRHESQAIFQKLSADERARFYAAQKARRTAVEFDTDSGLAEAERSHVLQTLGSFAAARPPVASPVAIKPRKATQSRLSVLRVAEARQRLKVAKGEGDGRDLNELLREVIWSLEEGSLAKFETRHALSIACKKVREGAWSRPFRMPVDWRVHRALPETCGATGRD